MIQEAPEVIQRRHDEQDAAFGYDRYSGAERRVGWLLTMHTTTITDEKKGITSSAVDYYFYEQDGGTFKATVTFAPYFLSGVKTGSHASAEAYLRRRFEGKFSDIECVEKEDLDLANHLSGLKKVYIKVQFNGEAQFMETRREVQQIVRRNKVTPCCCCYWCC
jgi:DNA polymerase epsilon subunit 1